MRNVHRVFVPGINQNESGIIADTTYKVKEGKIEITNFTIRVILDKKIGEDISNIIDKTTYYTILLHSQDEIEQIYKQEDGSKYK
tara:strand:+ start:50 stop:304 length:255 start_codon:yes stop_codon:yes gene_type:complete